MSDIKVGDLVMIVKLASCCGKPSDHLGRVVTVTKVDVATGVCGGCGDVQPNQLGVYFGNGLRIQRYRVVKIDPPAEGDSLPTRADLEVTA